MPDEAHITLTLKRLMDLLFKNTTLSLEAKEASVRSVRAEPLKGISLLTITIRQVRSGVSYADAVTQDSLGLWIRDETLDEHIAIWEKAVDEFEKFLGEK